MWTSRPPSTKVRVLFPWHLICSTSKSNWCTRRSCNCHGPCLRCRTPRRISSLYRLGPEKTVFENRLNIVWPIFKGYLETHLTNIAKKNSIEVGKFNLHGMKSDGPLGIMEQRGRVYSGNTKTALFPSCLCNEEMEK